MPNATDMPDISVGEAFFPLTLSLFGLFIVGFAKLALNKSSSREKLVNLAMGRSVFFSVRRETYERAASPSFLALYRGFAHAAKWLGHVLILLGMVGTAAALALAINS